MDFDSRLSSTPWYAQYDLTAPKALKWLLELRVYADSDLSLFKKVTSAGRGKRLRDTMTSTDSDVSVCATPILRLYSKRLNSAIPLRLTFCT